jgi:hypothetical protein
MVMPINNFAVPETPRVGMQLAQTHPANPNTTTIVPAASRLRPAATAADGLLQLTSKVRAELAASTSAPDLSSFRTGWAP